MNNKISVKLSDLKWLAGLIDGDGCFLFDGSRARILLSITDEDIVARAAKIMQSTYAISKRNVPKNYKQIYTTCISNNLAISFMECLHPYMSLRRQQKIDEVLASYKIKSSKERMISSDDAEKIKVLNQTMSHRKIAPKYGVSHETIRSIINDSYVKEEKQKYAHSYTIDIVEDDDSFVHWLSGVFEAEGSFMKGPPSSPATPIMSIQMTDKDTIEKIDNLLGSNHCSFLPKGKSKDGAMYKEVFMSKASGKRAIDWMTILKPYMGCRRQEQIEVAIASYNSNVAKNYHSSLQKIKDTELEKIFKARSQGQTLEKIAQDYNVTRNVIRRCLKKFDVISKKQLTLKFKKSNI